MHSCLSTSRSTPMSVDRRLFLTSLLGAAAGVAGLSGCADSSAAADTKGASTAPLADRIPAGTSLKISSYAGHPATPVQAGQVGRSAVQGVELGEHLRRSRCHQRLPRRSSLDLANNAGIPPIQAHFQGFDAKIVAINVTRKPNYLFATKPGSDIRTRRGLQGQEAGLLPGPGARRRTAARAEEGRIAYDDVELVPLTSNQFLTALQSGQVDIAPLATARRPRTSSSTGQGRPHASRRTWSTCSTCCGRRSRC